MPIETAELIYQALGVSTIAAAFLILFWMHREFHDERLSDAPRSLSDGQLRRILGWGKMIHRINADTPKGEKIMERMGLALDELRRRRAEG
jgi:hypothetical protein